jgi:hypothetical protein
VTEARREQGRDVTSRPGYDGFDAFGEDGADQGGFGGGEPVHVRETKMVMEFGAYRWGGLDP